MPLTGLNWLDWLIIVFVSLSVIQGVKTGLVRSAFTFVGLVIGLIVSVMYYVRASEFILSYIEIPQFIADAASFLIIFSIVTIIVHTIGSVFAIITRFSLLRLVDKLGGLAAGLLIGLALAGFILILLTSFPLFVGFPDQVEDSSLAQPLIEYTHSSYAVISDILPVDLPELAHYPEELSSYFSSLSSYAAHDRIDFAALDGSICFVCESPVQFLGYLDNNKGSLSPKFTCSGCERTSDGCQTYEGYHEMYSQCPVELGNLGYRLNCGIWTNSSYHRPTGPCPVCGIE